MTNDKSVLASHALSKTYFDGDLKVDVLDHVDFNIDRGERVAIIGPSGSGKSTLLHLLGGLDKPTHGEVFLTGQSLQSLNEKEICRLRNYHLGFVYQFHHLLAEFTALENVAMPLLIRGLSVKEAESRAERLLKNVGLAQRLHHKLGQLSGGERQRVAIARALVTEPSCLLADEPTGNLDHKTAETIYELMFQLNETMKTSLLIVTHDLRLAQRMNRVLQLENGRLEEFR